MKHSKLLVIALFSCLGANAQTKVFKMSHPDKRVGSHTFYDKIMKQQAERFRPAAKTTATDQRVIAQAEYYEAPFTSVGDSAIFKYSGSRGSYFAPEYFTYTPNSGSPSFDHFYDLFGFDTYYGTKLRRNEDLFAKSDTTIFMGQDWGSSTPTFGVLGVESHQWDAGNNLTESIFLRDAASISQRDSITYNTDGGIATVHEFVWGGGSSPVGTWLPQYCSYFRYNAAGNMVVDSQGNNMGSWVQGDRYTYSYDAAGNMVRAEEWQWGGTDYDLRMVYEMSYDAGNRLIRYRLYDANTNELTLDDSLGYTTGATYPTYTRVKEYTGGALDWMEVMTKNVTTHGKPDTLQMMSYDADSTTVNGRGLAALVYNTYHNPDKMTVYYDDGAGAPTTEAGRIFYYYETYSPTNVRDVATVSDQSLQLYPNPASTEVSIPLNGSGATTISIADMSGRVVKTATATAQQSSITLPLTDLPAGVYLATTTQYGRVTGRARLVKN